MRFLSNNISKPTVRFTLVGIVSVLSDLTVYHLFLFNQFSTGIAKSVGYFFGVAISYFGNNGYTFEKKKKIIPLYFSVYLCTWFLNTFTNFGMLALLDDRTSSNILLAWGLSTLLSAGSNFILLSRLVFK